MAQARPIAPVGSRRSSYQRIKHKAFQATSLVARQLIQTARTLAKLARPVRGGGAQREHHLARSVSPKAERVVLTNSSRLNLTIWLLVALLLMVGRLAYSFGV